MDRVPGRGVASAGSEADRTLGPAWHERHVRAVDLADRRVGFIFQDAAVATRSVVLPASTGSVPSTR